MGTHRVTIELPEDSYNLLRSVVDSGEYASESDVIADLIPVLRAEGLNLLDSIPPANGTPSTEWLNAEAIAAFDEHQANPSAAFTSQQVLAWLEEERTRDLAAR